MGNNVDNTEVGMISPAGEDWFLLFEYKPEGYVKDDEKDQIDKEAILESYRRGTEEGNKRRKEIGLVGLHVTGWFEEPHYSVSTHNLVWALRAKGDDGSEVVNYNVRLLGREGYMSITLVDEPSKMDATKPRAESVLGTFAYQKGKTYAEFRPGDKIVKYGLVALVAGGAGATAAKLGLFAALGKVFAKAGGARAIRAAAAAAAQTSATADGLLSGAADTARVRSRRAAFEAFVPRISLASGLMWAAMFVALPSALFGSRAAWPVGFVLAAIAASYLATVWLAHAALVTCGIDRADRVRTLLPLALFPPSAAHALSVVERELYAPAGTLTLAAEFLDPPSFERFASRHLRRIGAACRAAAGSAAEPVWRAQRTLSGSVLRSTGRSGDALVGASEPLADASAASSCPLCGADYRSGVSRCSDCGVELRPFP
jgi:hypothetical protein